MRLCGLLLLLASLSLPMLLSSLGTSVAKMEVREVEMA